MGGQDHSSDYEQVLGRLIKLNQLFQRLERDAFFQSFELMFGNCFFVSPTKNKLLLSKPAYELVDEYLDLRHLGRRDALQLGLLEVIFFQDYMSAVRWWMRGEHTKADNEEYLNFNLGQVLSKFPIVSSSAIQRRYKLAFAFNYELEVLMLTQPTVLITADDWRVIGSQLGDGSA